MNLFRVTRSFIALTPLVSAVAFASDFENRDEIPAKYKWDLEGLFYDSWETWEVDLKKTEELYRTAAGYKGRLSEGPDTLLEFLRTLDEAQKLVRKVYAFTSFQRDTDASNQEVQGRFREVLGMFSQISPLLAWSTPELLELGEERVISWVDSKPEMEEYRFGLQDTFRTAGHTLDEDGEKLLSFHSPVRSAPRNIFQALTTADALSPEIELSSGETFKVTAGTYGKALQTLPDEVDRAAVQTAWMDTYDQRKNTIASIYDATIQQGWSVARSRTYESTLEMRLDGNAIPMEVYDTLVETAKKGADAIQKYHRLRRDWLALKEPYGWADMFVPLIQETKNWEYEEVIPIIVESVRPLGEEYAIKMGEQFAEGFVDVFETPGKRSGAYNSGVYGVGSFVLLNFHGTLDNVFTVAHEMGHSMHTRLSQEYQPYSTHGYTIFVAEVASILNEKLLLDELMEQISDPAQRIAFLEKQISDIHGTFFLQTMMAEYERAAHHLGETGQGITSERLTSLWREIVGRYFGDIIPEDDPYFLSWARIPHLFNSPFYVYQYATCYASAAQIKGRMDAGDPEVVDQVLTLLKSGGNDYPVSQLQKAGVDLTQSDPVEAVVAEFAQLVDRLEQEYTAYLDSVKSDS